MASNKKYIDTWLANARKAHSESAQFNESTFDSVAHAVANQVIRNTIKEAFLNEASRKAARRVDPDLPQCPPGFIYSRRDKTCVPKTPKDDVKLRVGVNLVQDMVLNTTYGVGQVSMEMDMRMRNPSSEELTMVVWVLPNP